MNIQQRIWTTLLSLWLTASLCSAQTTIYSEDFGGTDGATNGTGWSAFSGKCDAQTDFDFNTSGGAFVIRNVEGRQCDCPAPSSGDNSNVVQFESLDITDFCNVSVSFSVSSSGDMECADGGSQDPIYCAGTVPESGRDVIFIEANVDGTRTTLFYQCGNNIVLDNRSAVFNGDNIALALIGGTGTADEIYTFDKLLVEGTQLNPITITSDISSPICEGQSITLTADGPGPWNWGIGPTTQSITITPGFGNTNYTVSRPKGCGIETGNFNVVTLEAPEADAGDDRNICAGESTTLMASGGTTYLWEDGSTSPARIVGPQTNTTYRVTVTSATCSAEDEVNVQVDPLPDATITPNVEICAGASTTLVATGGDRYEWPNGESTPSITVSPTTITTYVVTVYDGGCSEAVFSTVSIAPSIEFSTSGELVICEDESTLIELSGGDQYMWEDGNTDRTRTLSPSTTTDYTITVTNSGCTSVETFTIVVNPLPIIDAGADQTICAGETTTLEASGGSTYLWSNGTVGRSIDINPNRNTIYFVNGTLNGCSNIDEVMVTVTENPVAQIQALERPCIGDDIILRASGGSTYAWDDNSTLPNRTTRITESSNYSVTVTQDGCTDVAIVSLDPKSLPELTGTSDQTICQGDTLQLNQFGAESITWSTGQTGASIEVSPEVSTTYYIEGISDNCMSRDSIVITVDSPFAVDLGGDQAVCIGSNIIITPDLGDRYNWTVPNTPSIANRPLTISPLTDTTVTVESFLGACTAKDEIRITVNDLPQPEIAGSTTYCPESFTTLSTPTAYSNYEWSNGTSASTAEISAPSTVSVIVEDANGCIGQSPAITITENSQLYPTILGGNTLCEGSIKELRGGSGFASYLWSYGSTIGQTQSTGISLLISDPGSYNLAVTSADGCAGDTTIVISSVSNPIVEITGDTALCVGESALLSVGDYNTIEWNYNELNISAPSISTSMAGLVSVDVTDNNGCSGSANTTISVSANPTISISGNRFFCEGDSTEIEISGDFVQLQWDDFDISSAKYFDSEDTYIISATNEYMCRTDSSVSIIERSLPEPTIVAPRETCIGDTISLTILESYESYLWQGAVSSPILEIFRGGNYDVEVIDEYGCIGTARQRINSIDPPEVSFREAITVCNFPSEVIMNPHLLNLDTTFLNEGMQGSWRSDTNSIIIAEDNTIDFSGVTSGEYEFNFTTNFAELPCTDLIFPLLINVRECLCPEITLQAIDTLCSLDDELNLGEIQQSDFEGSWQLTNAPSSDMPSIENDIFNAVGQIPGDYEFEFRLIDGIAPLGCDQSKSVQVHVAPFIEADIDIIQEACPGMPAELGLNLSGGTSYNVTLELNTEEQLTLDQVSGDHRFEIAVSDTTLLRFADISSNEGSCAFRSSANSYLLVPKFLEASIESVNSYDGYEVSCPDANDGSLTVNITQGTAPYTYSWSNGATTSNISGIYAGTYGISVTDADGCIFEGSAQADEPPPTQVSASTMDPTCYDELGNLVIQEIQDEHSDSWEILVDDESFGFQNQFPFSVYELNGGIHTVEIINERGCSNIFNFETKIPETLQIQIDDLDIRLGESISLNPLFNFEVSEITWSPPKYLDCPDCLSTDVNPLSSIEYVINALDENNCSVSKTVRVAVDKERSLVVPTGFTANYDGINDPFIIHGGSDISEIENVEIYNRFGELVFQSNVAEKNVPAIWDWTFRGKDLPPGEYVYQIQARRIDEVSLFFKGSFQLIR